MRNGDTVRQFEEAFASYVGARFAIGMANGTSTLQAALVALGVKPGDRVAVPPLTMSATSIAALNVGAVPVFMDVDPQTWLMPYRAGVTYQMPVSLYGLHAPHMHGSNSVDDAAQTLRPHGRGLTFTSYSFQASKILALGEGGMLCTDDPDLAQRAREYASLGYRLSPTQSRIDPAVIKSPSYERHHSLGINARMNDLTAAVGLTQLMRADDRKNLRQMCANLYRNAVDGCPWMRAQYVPDGWCHDMWSYAVALDDAEFWDDVSNAVEAHGGERPYACWRLTYQEPAFRHLAPDGTCPIAESLQPRILSFQTNNLESAKRNAHALHCAIREVG